MPQGRPIGEPVAQAGPFVKSTEAQIREAFAEFAADGRNRPDATGLPSASSVASAPATRSIAADARGRAAAEEARVPLVEATQAGTIRVRAERRPRCGHIVTLMSS